MTMLLILSALAIAPAVATAEDRLYRCEDGTLTNRAELLCPDYEPKGRILIAPTGATLTAIRALIPTERPDRPPDPLDVCDLYWEWVALNLRTGGGVTFSNTQDVPRWNALARIFTAIPVPNCP